MAANRLAASLTAAGFANNGVRRRPAGLA